MTGTETQPAMAKIGQENIKKHANGPISGALQSGSLASLAQRISK